MIESKAAYILSPPISPSARLPGRIKADGITRDILL